MLILLTGIINLPKLDCGFQTGRDPPSKSRAQTIIGTTWNFIHISKDSLNQGCYHKIKYVNEAKWSDEPIRIGNGKSFVDFSDSEYRDYVAIYKDKRWEFQDETRFIIFAVPGGLEEEYSEEKFFKKIKSGITSRVLYIDLPIKCEAFETMEILLVPNATKGTKLLVEALIEKYHPQIKVKTSALANKNVL